MATSKTSNRKRANFHHGNVKTDAVFTGLELLKSTPFTSLSVRKIADHIGVAHRAVLSCFGDKNGLLNALATAGYNQLADHVANAPDAEGLAERYITFGLENPHLYTLMTSRPHATMSDFPALQTAAHRVITTALKFYGSTNHTSADNRRAVMQAYIILHGGLTLRQAGILDIDSDQHLIAELQQMLSTSSK